ncbi:hypothetical protein Mro03_48700 [Microbispora rosea subsp. rosea]|nr:hypothetical protein Mro03_48700 [Microbispora rosea subsp. rosea]
MSPSGIGTAVRGGGDAPAPLTLCGEEERARSEADGAGGEVGAPGARATDGTLCPHRPCVLGRVEGT